MQTRVNGIMGDNEEIICMATLKNTYAAWQPTQEFLDEYPIFDTEDLLPPSGNIKVTQEMQPLLESDD